MIKAHTESLIMKTLDSMALVNKLLDRVSTKEETVKLVRDYRELEERFEELRR